MGGIQLGLRVNPLAARHWETASPGGCPLELHRRVTNTFNYFPPKKIKDQAGIKSSSISGQYPSPTPPLPGPLPPAHSIPSSFMPPTLGRWKVPLARDPVSVKGPAHFWCSHLSSLVSRHWIRYNAAEGGAPARHRTSWCTTLTSVGHAQQSGLQAALLTSQLLLGLQMGFAL